MVTVRVKEKRITGFQTERELGIIQIIVPSPNGLH